VEWILNGVKLEEDLGVKISRMNDEHYLSIDNCEVSHAGDLTLKARNPAGNVTKTVEIMVTGEVTTLCMD